jgi:hypothetical protein
MAKNHALSRVFTAKYRGRCGVCDELFPVGERIRYVGETLAHAACAVPSSPAGPAPASRGPVSRSLGDQNGAKPLAASMTQQKVPDQPEPDNARLAESSGLYQRATGFDEAPSLSEDPITNAERRGNDDRDSNPKDSGEAAQKPGSGAASDATREGTSLSRKPTELQHLEMRTFSLMKRLTERAMVELTQDLLTGRIDEIPPAGADWIEDMLTGRLSLWGTTDFVFAYWWAQHGWEVFPQRGDGLSVISHPKGSPQRWVRRRCGQYGDGHLDATTDLARIRGWGRQYGLPWGGVGARVPQGVIALYIDPCRGGDEHLAALEEQYGALPSTQEIISEKFMYDPDGRHRYLFFQLPAAMELTERGLKNTGIALKTEGAAVRMPSSNHNGTSRRYPFVPRPVATAPDWLLSLLRPKPRSKRKASARQPGKQSIADECTKSTEQLADRASGLSGEQLDSIPAQITDGGDRG